METYFIADTHLGHKNIIKYQFRPFMSVNEIEKLGMARDKNEIRVINLSEETIQKHDNTIIDNINAVIQENDVLYHLGDFGFGKESDLATYRSRINCQNIFLIIGNHDKYVPKSCFSWVKNLYSLYIKNITIVLCHYPLLSWDKSHHGSYHLHGHCHGGLNNFIMEHNLQNQRRLDVGVDSHEFKPWSFAEIEKYMKNKSLLN